MSVDATGVEILSTEPNAQGYRGFNLGQFSFRRDEYFVYISWPTGSHVMSADAFLRAIQRDVAWDFFYGTVNFDGVFGTVNHYGTVDIFAGRYNDSYRKAELDYGENVETPKIRETFKAILEDWTNEGFDPFASPHETGSAFGIKHGSNRGAITRARVAAQRMVGVAGDEGPRTDDNGHPVNRMFRDVPIEEPVVEAEPGFEGEVAAFNLFEYLARSQVTWNPSVVSACKDSLFCPTTEEYILPIIHGNDRVEWFIQLSDEIQWEVEDRDSGGVRARVIMRAGDVAAMPADIRHQGYSPKRSMLLVWENNSADLPDLIASGQTPTYPAEF
jgi:Hydroquinone 1,2-dioxygenase large subunit N-terminal